MKKIKILFYSVMVLLSQSCIEEKMPGDGQFANSPYYLKLNRTTLTLSANGNLTGSLYISSRNTPWKITDIPYWLTVSPKKGNTDAVVDFTAKEHVNTSSSRVAVLYFQSDVEEYTFSRKITVTQQRASAPAARHLYAPQAAAADAGGAAMYFGCGSAYGRLQIADAAEWSAAVSDGWIALSQYSGNGGEALVISVQPNEGEDERSGYVTIATGEQVQRIAVVQQGQYLTLVSPAGDVEADGGSIEFASGTSFGTEVNVEYRGESNDWVTVENDGEGNYTLHVAANPLAGSRTAQFVIKPACDNTGNVSAGGLRFNITQSGICE